LPPLIGPTVTPLFPCVLVTHLVTSAVARSLLPRGLLNVQRSWSPPLAELRRRPPGVPYEVAERRSSPGGSIGHPRAGDPTWPTAFPQRVPLMERSSPYGTFIRMGWSLSLMGGSWSAVVCVLVRRCGPGRRRHVGDLAQREGTRRADVQGRLRGESSRTTVRLQPKALSCWPRSSGSFMG